MSRASDAARQFLWEIGYNDLVGQDLTQLVLSLGLYYDEEPLTGCEGRIVYLNDDYVKITVNSETRYEPRKRFSIAHEIGHYLLGHNKVHCDNPGTLDCYKQGNQEAEANEFASELLMPTPAFMKAIEGRVFSPQLIEEVSEHFGTSISSVVYRYVTCGPHPIAVVYSYKGKVVWMKKSRNLGRYMIDWKDLDVPKNSVTEEFFQYGVVYDTSDIQNIDLDVWFQVQRSRYQGGSNDSWRVKHALGGNRGWDSYEDADYDDGGGGSCHECCFVSERFGGVTAVIWED
ncbi:MAG: ImmA/IrrE family metallo-endopeptidase [Prevotella sp.]|nr:ImmA/IrrE family metallo-endopeptidase [Prevotella sp.]